MILSGRIVIRQELTLTLTKMDSPAPGCARWKTLRVVTALAVMAGLSACGLGDSDSSAGPALSIRAGAAPISGASCSLSDATGKSIAANAVTSSAGTASFTDVMPSTGLVLVTCTGGSATDLASGRTLTAPRLRAYTAAPAAGTDSTALVTPLTELAVRLLGSQPADAGYATMRDRVARAFGLEGIDIGRVTALDLSSNTAADDAVSRHGLALAALSQLESAGSFGMTTDALLSSFAANIDANGYPKDMALPLAYAQSIETVLTSNRLRTRLAAVGNTIARDLFDKAVHVEPLATIDYVDADDSPTDSGDALHAIEPNAPSTLYLGGRWLSIGLDVRLAGAECTLYDLATDEEEKSTGEQEVTAECPAQPAGKAMLTVKDAGIEVHRTEFTVQAGVKTSDTARKRALAVGNAPGTGPVTLTGTVSAIAPTVDTTSAAHNYAVTRTFTVKGVVVELLDRAANGAVLRDTVTDADGRYSFVGLDADRAVMVRVKAQLLKTRATGATTGAQWNLAVRDNTSTSSPKAMYVLDSAPLTTIADGTQTADIVATLGFAADGTAGADAARQSAPFSILEIAYSAMTKIEQTDANVVFPDVNFYWSPKNVGTEGDREAGQIGTSHYADSGTLPGVFILGKADADTDEFDQGVIGHEFGHWLQTVLSSSDNPGGSHAPTEFKDASLAYGEGYGTAVGGLLSGSPFYIDSSGVKQSGGGVTNLDQPTRDGVRKGFYSEESVQYVMYQIGKRHGFTAFWRAVSALRADHHSSTVFAFLARFIAANPAAQVADLLAAENIRSTDPLGRLPAGTAPDAAIAADQNKGESPAGAGDLEALYLPVTLPVVAAAAEPVALTPVNPPSFCINHNLKGAKLNNGLGMLKRFTFVANYTGRLGIKLADDKGAALDGKDTSISARSDRGGKVRANEWGDAVQISVQEGATYTLLFQQMQPNVFQGNRCGNTLSLWRMPA